MDIVRLAVILKKEERVRCCCGEVSGSGVSVVLVSRSKKDITHVRHMSFSTYIFNLL